MSAPDLDAVLERIARLWTEMQATRTRDPKHARLMAEIHDQSATYLRLLDLQRRLGEVDSAGKPDTPGKPRKRGTPGKLGRPEKGRQAG